LSRPKPTRVAVPIEEEECFIGKNNTIFSLRKDKFITPDPTKIHSRIRNNENFITFWSSKKQDQLRRQ